MIISIKQAELYGWSKFGMTPEGGFRAGMSWIGIFAKSMTGSRAYCEANKKIERIEDGTLCHIRETKRNLFVNRRGKQLKLEILTNI